MQQWELTESETVDHAVLTEMRVLVKPLPSRLRGLGGRGAGKILRARGARITPKIQCLPDTTGLMPTEAQTVAAHKIKLDGVLVPSGEVDMGSRT